MIGEVTTTAARHFAILLCRYADASDQIDVDRLRRLFTAECAGTGNLVDHFHEASNGRADLSGSELRRHPSREAALGVRATRST